MDPTYDKQQIAGNKVWQLAFDLSEIDNDNAPLGWYRYVWKAECLMRLYKMERNNVDK